MAKLADALDSKSSEVHPSWGFDSPLRHHVFNDLQRFTDTVKSPIWTTANRILPSRDFAEGSALFHLLRNLGSSVFISISVALVVRTTATSYAGFTEEISNFNEFFRYGAQAGHWSIDSVGGLSALSGEIWRQAAMIGYINAFYLYTIAAAMALPLLLLVRLPERTRTAG